MELKKIPLIWTFQHIFSNKVKIFLRIIVLKIIFIIDHMLRNSININSQIFRNRLCHMEKYLKMQGFHYIFNADWQKLKDIIRNMERKYESEDNDDNYKKYYEESVKLWMQLRHFIQKVQLFCKKSNMMFRRKTHSPSKGSFI